MVPPALMIPQFRLVQAPPLEPEPPEDVAGGGAGAGGAVTFSCAIVDWSDVKGRTVEIGAHTICRETESRDCSQGCARGNTGK